MEKVALGGGCHWCTEAVFDSLEGVVKVDQGWVAAEEADAQSLSEAVVIYYDEEKIRLDKLIEIHLLTHNATVNHSMRQKYRSAVYVFSQEQKEKALKILQKKAALFEAKIITKVYIFAHFKRNEQKYLSYYKKNRDKPFCQKYIEPKLQKLKSITLSDIS
jgi:peptide-methionine (S)-S-oxide reductase